MPSKDIKKAVLKGIDSKEKAQLNAKLSKLHALKDSVTNDEDKQALTEVIDLSTKANTYNKNEGFSNDLYTVATKLIASSNTTLQKNGKTLLNQLNTQKQAIRDWNDVNKKTVNLQVKINSTHRNILKNVVVFENAVVQDIISRNDSIVAQEAANAMSTSLAKAESKSRNDQNVKKAGEAKEAAITAKRKLEEHRAKGKSDKKSKLVELELQQEVELTYSKTRAGILKRNYQQRNAICGYTKENLVSIAIDHLRRGRFYVPLSATKRSKERCERFSEAFRSRDLKKVLSLYSNK